MPRTTSHPRARARTLALLAALVTAGTAGCDDPTREERTRHFFLDLVASRIDTLSPGVLRGQTCDVRATLALPGVLPDSGTAETEIRVRRELTRVDPRHREHTSADTTLAAMIHFRGLTSGDTLRIAITSSAWRDSLVQVDRRGTSGSGYVDADGAWACTTALPLAQHPRLVEHGFDSTLVVPAGHWHLWENLPID